MPCSRPEAPDKLNRRQLIALAGLAGLGVPARAIGAAQSGQPIVAQVDPTVLHVQAILDHLGWAPGLLTGQAGRPLELALRGFQQAAELPVTGAIDPPTLRALHRHRAVRPLRRIRLTTADLIGPFVNPIPAALEAQARLPALGYRSALEQLAEACRTAPDTIAALNSTAIRLVPGAELLVPNVEPVAPGLRAPGPGGLADAIFSRLGVARPKALAARVVIDLRESVVRALDRAGAVISHFPASSPKPAAFAGARRLRIGAFMAMPRAAIRVAGIRPPDPAKPDGLILPPGPNNPLGIGWITLSGDARPGDAVPGIHGTAEPQLIGQPSSTGGIALANWDVARLAVLVEPGIEVRVRR